jgi:hypothetical protein
MNPFGKRSYNFTYADDTSPTELGWRIGFAASDCEPRDGLFTCRGLSGEEPETGNAITDTFVTVSLSDGLWEVVDVEGNMFKDERQRLVGYTLPQREEPSHWEFPAVGVWPGDGEVFIEMMALWVGHFPTSAPGSVCEIRGMNDQGAVVDKRVWYHEAPTREFERGGWVWGTGIDANHVDVVVSVECRQFTGPGWEIARAPEIVGTPGDVSGVSAELVWRGAGGFTTSAECRATLVDAAGNELWEGSGNIERLWRPGELKDYPYRHQVFIPTNADVDAHAIGEFTCESI